MTERGLAESLSSVVGGKTAKALEKAFGMTTVDDLLRHYPRRYAERGTLTELSTLEEGSSVTVLADIEQVTVRQMQQRRGTILEAVVTDGRGQLSLTFFNQKWRERELRPGRRGLFAGQISSFRGKRQLAHPQCLDRRLRGRTHPRVPRHLDRHLMADRRCHPRRPRHAGRPP